MKANTNTIMKYRIAFVTLSLIHFLLPAQHSFFHTVPPISTSNISDRILLPARYHSIQLDDVKWTDFLLSVKNDIQAIQLPLPNGEMETFEIQETSILSEKLASLYPEHRSFSGWSIDTPASFIRMGWTGLGFYAIILRQGETIFIDPISLNDTPYYISYSKKDFAATYFEEFEHFTCYHKEEAINFDSDQLEFRNTGDQLRIFRLAVATTEDYTTALGGQTQAFDALMMTVDRVSAIFELELSIRLSLVSGTNLVATTSANPYPSEGIGTISDLADENQTNIDAVLGNMNYDIGHVFDVSPTNNSEGYSAKGSVCNTTDKAKGASRGFSNPMGDPFDIDLVAHEIGHQFNAGHTHNSVATSACSSDRNATSAFEPGSGTTIMSAINCGADNIQSFNDAYFHAASYKEIMAFVDGASLSTCPTSIATGNSIPIVNANPNGGTYVIPKSTPFELIGSATDADGDMLSYCWEELDLGAAGSPGVGTAPYFRSFPPSSSATRVFPELPALLDGSNTAFAEHLPTAASTLNFLLTVRDNYIGGGGVANSPISISVDGNAGPFEVTSQLAVINYTADGSNTFPVTWNKAGTDASPINCTTVDILLSTDGGNSFPYTLASGTPNDGLQTLTIPAFPTTNGRIKVKCADNIFFDINNAVVTIESTCQAEGASFTPDDALVLPTSDPGLDQNLTIEWGSLISNFIGSIATTDGKMNRMAGLDLDNGGCTTVNNSPYYDAYEFHVDEAGTYNFPTSSGIPVLNLYEFSFDPANTCLNWLASSGDIDEFGAYTTDFSLVETLETRKTYVLVVSGFGSNQTLSYSISGITGPGALYDGPVNPGTGFKYIYAIVNEATGKIEAMQDDPDLTNSATFPVGTYKVHGLSYAIGEDPTTYEGADFSTLLADIASTTLCAHLSANSKPISIIAALPVDLISFYGKREGENAALFWETATEKNNDYFTLERSTDGLHFEFLAQIEASGTTDEARSYSFKDKTPNSGINYYRLSQTDYDGMHQKLGLIAIEFPFRKNSFYLHPNPTKSNNIQIDINSSEPNYFQFELYSTTGQPILIKQIFLRQGMHNIQFPLPQQADGIYFLKAKSGNQAQMFKIIKIN